MPDVTIDELCEHIKANGHSVRYMPWYGEYVVVDKKGHPVACIPGQSTVRKTFLDENGVEATVLEEYGVRRPEVVKYRGAIDELQIKSPEKIAEEISKGIRVP